MTNKVQFTEIEYNLTKAIVENVSVILAAKIWGCTSKTIINRLKAFENAEQHAMDGLSSLFD